MAGLNATTAFNPLQALGQASAQKQGVPIPLTFGRETYYDPMPVDRPLGELPVETYEWNGSALNPVQPVGDVVDFRKRGLFPQLGTEGARGYAGGANPQGWNVGKPRTGSPEWNAQYESQAGLKPGSLEPSTRPPIQAEFPGRPAVPEMSAKQLGQAIRNRASEPRPDSLSPLMKPGMPGYNAKTDASQKNPALSKPADLSAERAWAQARDDNEGDRSADADAHQQMGKRDRSQATTGRSDRARPA